jgi:hypothetical protein
MNRNAFHRPTVSILVAALLAPACVVIDRDGGGFDSPGFGELDSVASEDMPIEAVEYEAEGVTTLHAAINRGNLVVIVDTEAETLVATPALRDLEEGRVQWGAVVEDGTLKLAVNVADDEEGGLDIELRVPPTLHYEIAVHAGDVSVTDAEEGGEIAVQDGNVHVALAALDSSLDIAVQQGDIDVELPDDLPAELTAYTDGDVDVDGLDFDGAEFAGTASGDLAGGEGESITLAAQDGNISVRAR